MSDTTTATDSADLVDQTALRSRAREAYSLLLLGFVAAPILAGLDKFFYVLVDWDKYVAPFLETLVGGQASTLMLVAGVVEVAAGIGMWIRPRIFSYVVAGWLGAIILNLLLIPGFFDVALRDLGLLLGALALGRLSGVVNADG
jgi:hypothetical protein